MLATEAQDGDRTSKLVRKLAAAWTVACDDAQVAALSDYAASLLRWNERINLTAARDVDRLVAEHFPDAFALARRLGARETVDSRVIDVGSGGGLPALPLALLRPELTIELCEPIAKKAAFLRTAIRELGLGGRASVRTARGEAVAGEIQKEGSRAFDVAMSRATLAPEKWLALGTRLVRPGGRIFVLTTPEVLPALRDREVYDHGRRALIEVVP
jgi:16S rRNA (guanine527-N7)-methyltransferase